MTVDELIAKLQELSLQGCGNIEVVTNGGELGHIINVRKQTLTSGSYRISSTREVICLHHN